MILSQNQIRPSRLLFRQRNLIRGPLLRRIMSCQVLLPRCNKQCLHFKTRLPRHQCSSNTPVWHLGTTAKRFWMKYAIILHCWKSLRESSPQKKSIGGSGLSFRPFHRHPIPQAANNPDFNNLPPCSTRLHMRKCIACKSFCEQAASNPASWSNSSLDI